MPQPQLAVSSTAPQSVFTSRILRTTAAVVLGSALVALCAQISIPLIFTPVPLTLQNFAVLLLGLLLAPEAAFAALALYLIEGAAGLPVFSLHESGAGVLFGPNGGYLLSYPFAAGVIGLVKNRFRPASFSISIFAAAAGSLIIYAMGAAWFSVLSGLPWSAILKMTVWPFLPGDALKVIAAGAVATGLLKLSNRNRQSGLDNETAI
jgi:biotin transport system substrate-specific component